MLSFVFWFLVTITAIVVLAYRSVPLRESTIALGLLLIIYTFIGDPLGFYLVLLWIAFGVLVSLNIPEIRQNYYSARIQRHLHWCCKLCFCCWCCKHCKLCNWVCNFWLCKRCWYCFWNFWNTNPHCWWTYNHRCICSWCRSDFHLRW